MKRVIAIGGMPGSGKSTLMKKIIEALSPTEKYNSYKLVPYLQKNNIYILGKYEEGEVFSGTDRMSMAVQPEAIKFLDSLEKDSIILFEGDRLFTSSFLEHCIDKYELDIVYLKVDNVVREERYKQRGSDQNKTWIQGRETKINNILTNMTLMFNVTSFSNNNEVDQKKIYHYIMEQLTCRTK